MQGAEMTTHTDTELDGLIASMLNASHCIVEDGAMRVHPARKVKLADIEKLATALRQLREENARLLYWLDNNTTFFDTIAPVIEGPNVPVLAAVCRRIWYHATDDQSSYPFSAVIALAKPDRRVAQRRVVRTLRIGFRDERNADRRKQEGSK
jgi:hypothetical protein